MKISLIDALFNSYGRNTEMLVLVYDDNDKVHSFAYGNIPDKIKQMKVERFLVASEKLTIIKVEGVINE